MQRVVGTLLLGALLGGCSSLVAGPSASARIPADFALVVDRHGILEADTVAQANQQLRQIAERTGVFGLVDTGAGPSSPSGERIASVTALGGSWLWARCTEARQCEIEEPWAWSDDLDEIMGRVARVPEPAPGQGVPPASTDLAAWVEWVGAVGNLAQEGAPSR